MELELIIAASNHEFLDKELREEAANFLRSPLQLELITSASCQVLEENDDGEENSLAYLNEDEDVLYDFQHHDPEKLQLLHCTSGYDEGLYPENDNFQKTLRISTS